MASFLIGRFGQGVVVVLLASLLVFLVMRLIPGDPAALAAGLTRHPQTWRRCANGSGSTTRW